MPPPLPRSYNVKLNNVRVRVKNPDIEIPIKCPGGEIKKYQSKTCYGSVRLDNNVRFTSGSCAWCIALNAISLWGVG